MSRYLEVLRRNQRWSDLERLVQEQESESESLEFKVELPAKGAQGDPQRAKKTNDSNYEIRRDAIALANARGGLLLYGVRELSGGVAGELVGLSEVESSLNRLRDVLAGQIDPPLDYRLLRFEPPSGSPSRPIVGVAIEADGRLRAVRRNDESVAEYWRRRDTSVRPMMPSEIEQEFATRGRQFGELSSQLGVLAVWGMRTLDWPHSVLRLPKAEFSELLRQLWSFADRADHHALAMEELGLQLEYHVTDAIQYGGIFENYRLSVSYFELILSSEIQKQPDSDEGRSARFLFRRTVEFGHMLSYQGNRRLQGNQNVIALGVALLAEAASFAHRYSARDCVEEVSTILKDQRQFYKTEPLKECFEYALQVARTGDYLPLPDAIRMLDQLPDSTPVEPPSRGRAS